MKFILQMICILMSYVYACDFDKLSEWSKSLVQNLYALNNQNYNEQMSAAKEKFSPPLWSTYMKDLNDAKYPAAIMSKSLDISNSILGIEEIVPNHNACDVSMKINAIFNNRHTVTTQTLRLNMTVDLVNDNYQLSHLKVSKIGEAETNLLNPKCDL